MSYEYSAFMGLGNFLIGLGFFIFFVVVTVAVANWSSQARRVSWKYDVLEMSLLRKLAKEKGMDLDVEEAKEEITSEKSFKKRVQEELVKKFLDEKKESAKK